jgi:MFS family permease
MTFALAYSAGLANCRRIAPKDIRSSVLSIFTGLYTGFGAGVGGLAGGFLYGAYGGQVTYFCAAGAFGTGWMLANAANLLATFRRGLKCGATNMRRVGSNVGARINTKLWRASSRKLSAVDMLAAATSRRRRDTV